MRVVDAIAIIVLLTVIVLLALIVARQRHMLRSAGAIPLAVRRGNRWLYGVARYEGEEFRWYRAVGLGPRPTRVLHRDRLKVVRHRDPTATELRSLPRSAVIVECRHLGDDITLALADGAYTGFVSWLESSAPQVRCSRVVSGRGLPGPQPDILSMTTDASAGVWSSLVS